MLYECMVLFSPELSSEELEAARAKVEDTLSKKGGSVALWDHWGDRRLTYPIKKKNRAFYSIAYIEANNEARTELVRTFKLSDAVLRHMIVVPPVAPDLAAIANKSAARAEYERERESGGRYGDRGDRYGDRDRGGDRYDNRGPRGDDRGERSAPAAEAAAPAEAPAEAAAPAAESTEEAQS